jgi:hypothetical protein
MLAMIIFFVTIVFAYLAVFIGLFWSDIKSTIEEHKKYHRDLDENDD